MSYVLLVGLFIIAFALFCAVLHVCRKLFRRHANEREKGRKWGNPNVRDGALGWLFSGEQMNLYTAIEKTGLNQAYICGNRRNHIAGILYEGIHHNIRICASHHSMLTTWLDHNKAEVVDINPIAKLMIATLRMEKNARHNGALVAHVLVCALQEENISVDEMLDLYTASEDSEIQIFLAQWRPDMDAVNAQLPRMGRMHLQLLRSDIILASQLYLIGLWKAISEQTGCEDDKKDRQSRAFSAYTHALEVWICAVCKALEEQYKGYHIQGSKEHQIHPTRLQNKQAVILRVRTLSEKIRNGVCTGESTVMIDDLIGIINTHPCNNHPVPTLGDSEEPNAAEQGEGQPIRRV